MGTMILANQTKRCNCCLDKKHLNETSHASPSFAEFFGSLFYPNALTVCRECHSKLNEAPQHDNSDVNRNVQSTEISSRSTAQDEEDCIICMASKKDHVLVPCGHREFCLACATRVQEVYKFCPICRVSVQSILKVHDV